MWNLKLNLHSACVMATILVGWTGSQTIVPAIPLGSPGLANGSNPGHTERDQRVADLLARGDRLLRAGREPQARDRYQRALDLNPYASAARERLALLDVSRGRYTQALAEFHVIVQTDPAWFEQARSIHTYLKAERVVNDALAGLERHLQRYPRDESAWLLLAAILARCGEFQRARDALTRLRPAAQTDTLDASTRAAIRRGLELTPR